MNKIVIVGHPESGYQEVESLLSACGMQAARPSRREGFTPVDIGSILCRAHGIPPFRSAGTLLSVEQVAPGAVWYGLALDLMLGNVDQELWGWADPQSVYLLDYWRDLDPHITFMLVYDRPHSVLTRAEVGDAASLSDETLTQRTHNWETFNAALLSFFRRNPQRCLLVHSQQVRESVSSYVQQVRARIKTPMSGQHEEILGGAAPYDGGGQGARSPALCGAGNNCGHAQTINPTTHTALIRAPGMSGNALALFLADLVVRQQPNSLKLYEDMQAVANLPLADTSHPGYTQMEAWLDLAAQSQQLREYETQAVKEKELLVEQLHRVQLQLEHHFLANQKQVEELRQRIDIETGRAAQLADQLSKAAARSAALGDSAQARETEQLLRQLHQLQEELARYHLENQRLKDAVPPPSPAPAPAPAPHPAYYGAAARVKRQLSYRLGSTLITSSRSLSGWLSLPFALARETRRFRREQRQRSGSRLPPIHKYRDAHEAERVRQHLSYRLGHTLIRHGRSPVRWVVLPFALRREIKDFRAARV